MRSYVRETERRVLIGVDHEAQLCGKFGGMRLILLLSAVFAQTALGSDHPGNVCVVGADIGVHVPSTWAAWRVVDVDGKEVGHGTVRDGTAQLGKLPTGYFEIREKEGS